MDIILEELYPVQVPDVKGEDVPVLLSKFLPELVRVIMAPLPAVGSEGLKGLRGLLHQCGDLHQERFTSHQSVDKVHKVSRSIVKPKL